MVWDWGETGGAAVTNVFYTLVYDQSDEIFRSPSQRSEGWTERANAMAKGTMLFSILQTEKSRPDPGSNVPSLTIRRLEGHFYLVTEYM